MKASITSCMDITALKLETKNIKMVVARMGSFISWRGLIWKFRLAEKSNECRQGTRVVSRIPAGRLGILLVCEI
jgi:hypothetical protein